MERGAEEEPVVAHFGSSTIILGAPPVVRLSSNWRTRFPPSPRSEGGGVTLKTGTTTRAGGEAGARATGLLSSWAFLAPRARRKDGSREEEVVALVLLMTVLESVVGAAVNVRDGAVERLTTVGLLNCCWICWSVGGDDLLLAGRAGAPENKLGSNAVGFPLTARTGGRGARR